MENSEYSYDDEFEISKSPEKDKPAAPVQDTKQYLEKQIAEKDKDALFRHTQEEKEKAMKQAKGETKLSSDAIVKEKLKDLQLEGGSRSRYVETKGVSDQIKTLNMSEAAKVRANIQRELQAKENREYLDYIEDLLTESNET